MGTSRRMRIVAVFALCAIAAAQDGIAEQQIAQNQQFSEAASGAILEAADTLKSMKSVAASEIKQMNRISQDAHKAEKNPTFKMAKIEAGEILKQAQDADQNENEQQTKAVKALKQVGSVMDSFHKAGVHNELGEAPETSGMNPTVKAQQDAAKLALRHLSEVQRALEIESSTSHTQHRIQEIEAEAEHTLIDSKLGESQLDASPSLDDLAKKVSFKKGQPKPVKKAEAKPSKGHGALAALSQVQVAQPSQTASDSSADSSSSMAKAAKAPAPAKKAAKKAASAETMATFKKIERQEAVVMSAEKMDQNEVQRLVEELS